MWDVLGWTWGGSFPVLLAEHKYIPFVHQPVEHICVCLTVWVLWSVPLSMNYCMFFCVHLLACTFQRVLPTGYEPFFMYWKLFLEWPSESHAVQCSAVVCVRPPVWFRLSGESPGTHQWPSPAYRAPQFEDDSLMGQIWRHCGREEVT